METTAPTSPLSDDLILEHLATDYAEYITPPTEPDVSALDESIEELLTKLDEYCGLIDIVRSDTTLCLNRTLPEIRKKSEAMKGVFERIDQLEVFVGMVKAQVASMEALVDQAEAEMSSSTVKKFLNAMPSFFSRKSQPKVERHLSKFEPPEVFKTEEYFPKEDEAEGATGAKDTDNKDNTTKEDNSAGTKEVEKEEIDSQKAGAKDSGANLTEEKKESETSSHN